MQSSRPRAPRPPTLHPNPTPNPHPHPNPTLILTLTHHSPLTFHPNSNPNPHPNSDPHPHPHPSQEADPPSSSTLAPGDDTSLLLAYAGSVGLEALLAYTRSGLIFVAAHRRYARLQARLLGALMAADHEYFECTPSASVQQLFATDLEAVQPRPF